MAMVNSNGGLFWRWVFADCAGTNGLSDSGLHHHTIAKPLGDQFLYNILTQNPVSKPNMVVHICSPRTLGVEAGG